MGEKKREKERMSQVPHV